MQGLTVAKLGLAAGALFVIADASLIDAAIVAALGSIANTWLLLRHDRKVDRLERTIRELRHQAAGRRRATRAGDRDVLVIDPDLIEQQAHELEEGR